MLPCEGPCYSPPATSPVVRLRACAEESIGGSDISRDLRVNQMIRVPQVRVVDEEGAQLGVLPTPEALRIAQERGYDLVEVAPMAVPPVVKFLDFGQYKYELTKREKEAKRKQRSVTFKEVRLKPKIGVGDFDTKVRRAVEFLEEGDRVKVAVQFRGRELTHPEIGRNLLAKFSEAIKEHGVVERAPLLEGKSMHITVASTHKPKGSEHLPATGTPAAERPGGTPVAAPPPAPSAAPVPVEAAPAAAPAAAGQAEAAPAAAPAERPAAKPRATAPKAAAAKTTSKTTTAKTTSKTTSTKKTTDASAPAKTASSTARRKPATDAPSAPSGE